MKKFLCLTIVLALVAPAMAVQLETYATQTNQLKISAADTTYSVNLNSRKGERIPLAKFDNLATDMGAYTAGDIVSAQLRLHATFMEDATLFGSRQPHQDSNAYGRVNPMLHSYDIDPTWNESDNSGNVQWLGNNNLGGSFDGFSTDTGNFDYDAPEAEFYVPLGMPAVSWPLPLVGDEKIDDRYQTDADITQLVKDWVSGARPNYGMFIGLYVDVIDAEGDQHGTNQINWDGGNGPNLSGDWWGNAVITITVPEPATMSFLALGGLAALIRRKR